MIIDDGRKLAAAKQDADGYFCDIPAIALGKVTRNNTAYEVEPTVAQLRGPDTSIYKRLTEGVLFSEYGHPFVDLSTELGLSRLLHLEPTRKSSHIRKMEVRHIDDLDLDIIFMDMKPAGPYGQYFAEQMLDPTQNCAFSLRGISKVRIDRASRVVYKRLNPLVTIDTGMAGGGFKVASKRYMPSVESLSIDGEDIDIPIDMEVNQSFQEIALEHFTNSEINELFKSKSITIGTVLTGQVTEANTIMTPDKLPTGLMHSILQSKK